MLLHRTLPWLLCLILLAPGAANAQETEAWTSLEVLVPLHDTASAGPHALRIANDFRYGAGYPGIGQALLRVGPIWDPLPMLQVAAHLSSNVEQRAPGSFVQEMRGEIEPSLKWRVGDLQVHDRFRVERRWFPTEARWRLRNRVQLTYQPKEWTWTPFVSEEGFLEDGSFNQSRLRLGAWYRFSPHSRIAPGYMLVSKESGGIWEHTQVLTLSYQFSPQMEPLFAGSPRR